MLEDGDPAPPEVVRITPDLGLLAGDLALGRLEAGFAEAWLADPGARTLARLSAPWRVVQAAAEAIDAALILIDLGPTPGAITRTALIASDFVLVPLGPDLRSLHSLWLLGPMIQRWRAAWAERLAAARSPDRPLPAGRMAPIGYVVQELPLRLTRTPWRDDRWAVRMPDAYARALLGAAGAPGPSAPAHDPNCLAILKPFRSLVGMALEARKPIFALTVADGAIASHAVAVTQAWKDYRALADRLSARIGLGPDPDQSPTDPAECGGDALSTTMTR